MSYVQKTGSCCAPCGRGAPCAVGATPDVSSWGNLAIMLGLAGVAAFVFLKPKRRRS